MHTPALDDFLTESGHDDSFEHETPARRKTANKAAVKPPSRNTQAWRAIEDKLASRHLDRQLKEVYDLDDIA